MNTTLKKILIGLVICIVSLLIMQTTVFAEEDDDEEEEVVEVECTNVNIVLCKMTTSHITGAESDFISKLQSYYAYTKSDLYNEFSLGINSEEPLYIYITDGPNSNGEYTIKIGETDKKADGIEIGNRKFTAAQLKNKLACPYEKNELTKGTNWDVQLIVETDMNDSTVWYYKGTFTITYAYHGEKSEKISEMSYNDSDKISFTSLTTIALSFVNTVEDTVYRLVDGVADVYNWVEKFKTNAIGTIVNLILDGIMNIFGDGPQLMINYVQKVVDGTASDNQMLYTIDELEDDSTNGVYAKIDKYTKITEYSSSSEFEEADVNIEDTDKTDYGADEDTEGKGYMFEDNLVPVTSVDLYTMAANKVSFLDVNFFTTETAGADSTIWLKLREFVVSIIRASIYIAAIILIMALIWYGVKIVINSMDPRERAEDKEGLNRFITGVTMLVGSIIIMAISIYAYQAVGIDENDSDEFPIRVNVTIVAKTWWEKFTIKDQNYSFSTTITGYMRFMAQIENPDRCMEKAGYVIAYVILANMNVIIFVIMVVRMLAMWILAMVGPILAALYAITRSDKMMDRYRTWAYCYLILGFIQLFFAIAYWIMMETMGFN